MSYKYQHGSLPQGVGHSADPTHSDNVASVGGQDHDVHAYMRAQADATAVKTDDPTEDKLKSQADSANKHYRTAVESVHGNAHGFPSYVADQFDPRIQGVIGKANAANSALDAYEKNKNYKRK